ncbi:hypothetical protein [Methanolacinia petrolearia]|uniref:hypothetical protein n=1 Tax=Methanolacinia petrolearia TaxID=54120 RepID=UPI000A0693C4|nr:hypothetical protein [Methanolacinia petrolearia]
MRIWHWIFGSYRFILLFFVRNGKVCLDEHVVPLGVNAGFECAGVVINEQHFTKTSNIWGIENRKKGTNTNRIAVFRKPE